MARSSRSHALNYRPTTSVGPRAAHTPRRPSSSTARSRPCHVSTRQPRRRVHRALPPRVAPRRARAQHHGAHAAAVGRLVKVEVSGRGVCWWCSETRRSISISPSFPAICLVLRSSSLPLLAARWKAPTVARASCLLIGQSPRHGWTPREELWSTSRRSPDGEGAPRLRLRQPR